MAGLMGVWVAIILLVNPGGEFPLNDDWVYAGIVKTILAGRLHFEQSANANFLTQGFWGALFCLPFGFSFTALRISTLVLAGGGILGLYSWARQLHAPQSVAVLMAATLMANPAYLGLAHTFMTDVPFTALVVLCLDAYTRYLRGNGRRHVVLAFTLGFLALGIRQFGLVIILALSIGCMIRWWRPHRIYALLALAPFLIALKLQSLFSSWLQGAGGQPRANTDSILQAYLIGSKYIFSSEMLAVVCSVLLYLGLFLMPFLIFIYDGLVLRDNIHTKRFLIAIWATCSAISLAVLDRFRMPLFGNVITYFGMGPLTLHDTYILGRNYPELSFGVEAFWRLASMVAVLGALVLITTLARALTLRGQQDAGAHREHWRNLERPLAITLVIATFGYGLVISVGGVGGGIFDRYLLPLYPLTMMLVWLSIGGVERFSPASPGRSLALLMLVGMGTMSLLASHDYLSWNRTRWQALNQLVGARRINPARIDGGYEFNGMFTATRQYARQPGKSWWWVRDDEYIVASGPLDGYRVVATYPVPQWLPFKSRQIVTLQRVGPKPTFP